MSIWTSKRAAVVAALFALTGCVAGQTGGSQASGDSAVPVRVSTLGGAVTVAGPRGYCIDRPASRDGGGQAFVLLGSCASLSASPFAPRPRDAAILTATVLDGGGDIAGSFGAMDGFFRSEAGRSALSRSGAAASVEVLQTGVLGGVFMLRARDSAPLGDGSVQGDSEYWRAILAVNGRMVTLSVLGLAGRPLPDAAKRSILDAFLARMRAENPPATTPAAAPAQPPAG